jgi:putative transposase
MTKMSKSSAAPISETATSTNPLRLEPGEKLTFCKAPYLVGAVNNGQVQLTHCDTSVMQLLTWKQIEEEYLQGNIAFPERSGAGSRIGTANDNVQYALELCPTEDMEKALRLKEYMEAIRSEYPNRVPNKELLRISYEVAERIADASPLGKDQLRKYLKRWDRFGRDIRSLLPQTQKRGNRTSRLDPNLDVMIYDVIASVYEKPEQPSTTAVYNALCSRVIKANEKLLPDERLTLPSERTLMKAIRKRMGPEAVARRKGKKAANLQYRPVYQRPRGAYPHERVQIDTKTLDVFVLKDGTPKRPYLTAMLDEFSGCLVGYYIGFDAPCAENVLKCLFHAINVKKSQLNNAYECYGLMDTIISDNGTESKNEVVVSTLGQFGINVQWCDAATPEQKARIERFFRTIDLQLFHDLPGTTKGNVKDLGDYKAKKEATITLENLRSMFEKYIVDVYHQSYHRGVKGVPSVLWAEGVAKHRPRVPGSVLDLAVFLPDIDTRVIQSKGIELETNFYNSPELAQLRNGEKGKKVRVKWDDTDLSYVFVENPDTRQYFKVPSVNLAKTNGLTTEEQKAKMKAENEDRRAAKKNPLNIQSKGELSDMIEGARRTLPPLDHAKTTFNPYGSVSKEVQIQNQVAAIPPSGSDFADLNTGSPILSSETECIGQNDGHNRVAANENAYDDDDGLAELEARRSRALAGEG